MYLLQRVVYCNRGSMDRNNFGRTLRRLREEKGFSQHQLAYKYGYLLGKEYGVTPSQIASWESGRRRASRKAIGILGKALKATPEEHDELLIAAGFVPEGGMPADPADPVDACMVKLRGLLTAQDIEIVRADLNERIARNAGRVEERVSTPEQKTKSLQQFKGQIRTLPLGDEAMQKLEDTLEEVM